MTSHTVGTRETWLKARLALLEAEKELTRRSDAVAVCRSRCAPTSGSPARRQAAWTTLLTAVEVSPAYGARACTNSARHPTRGRPRRQ